MFHSKWGFYVFSEAHWKLHFIHYSGNFVKLTPEMKGGKDQLTNQ